MDISVVSSRSVECNVCVCVVVVVLQVYASRTRLAVWDPFVAARPPVVRRRDEPCFLEDGFVLIDIDGDELNVGNLPDVTMKTI